jgi:selenocysteine-specific elongation factor
MSQPGILPVYNVSCGLLGHVDSGKTSLARALSSTLSTAALDKSPQSAERGITLDLGFSSFAAPLPSHLIEVPYSGLQVTLVDCPGHASLIRTIVGGAQIVDFIVLVVDCTKGARLRVTAHGQTV